MRRAVHLVDGVATGLHEARALDVLLRVRLVPAVVVRGRDRLGPLAEDEIEVRRHDLLLRSGHGASSRVDRSIFSLMNGTARSSAPVVLVHGAWHGSWAWSRVTPLLAAARRPAVARRCRGARALGAVAGERARPAVRRRGVRARAVARRRRHPRVGRAPPHRAARGDRLAGRARRPQPVRAPDHGGGRSCPGARRASRLRLRRAACIGRRRGGLRGEPRERGRGGRRARRRRSGGDRGDPARRALARPGLPQEPAPGAVRRRARGPGRRCDPPALDRPARRDPDRLDRARSPIASARSRGRTCAPRTIARSARRCRRG